MTSPGQNRASRFRVIWIMVGCLWGGLEFSFALDLVCTEAEQAFLDAHPTIRVANEMDWPPFDFVEDGKATGYSIDLFDLVAQKTGLAVEYINGHTWDTLLNMGKRREIDVFPAMWKSEERERFFLFSDAYIDTPYILVVHQDRAEICDMASLKGRSLTGIKGFASTIAAKQVYPDIHITEVESAVDGLRQVSYGMADAYLGSMAETNFRTPLMLHSTLKES